MDDVVPGADTSPDSLFEGGLLRFVQTNSLTFSRQEDMGYKDYGAPSPYTLDVWSDHFYLTKLTHNNPLTSTDGWLQFM